jgi:UDP-N-acetylglucosamine:LPS N-acetylglucosamine transferase
VFVLDYKHEKSIAGDLAPSKYKKSKKLEYVGILSQYNKINEKENIDYLVVISGYLLEHKQEFYERIVDILKTRKGKKVFIMGDYINDYHKKLPGDIEVYSSFKNLNKNKLYNQAKIIISRTGYSTLMDLIELNKDAILIPTPNESEQMYLGKYHENKGYFNIIQSQKKINKNNLTHNKKNTELIKKSNLPKTKETIKRITTIINEYTK